MPTAGVDARWLGPTMSVVRALAPVEQRRSLANSSPASRSSALSSGLAYVEEKQHQPSSLSAVTTVLRAHEIDDLKKFHDNSLAASTRRAYLSDYESFVEYLAERFPRINLEEMQTQWTLEHVLAYLNQLCNDGSKISTTNRMLSTIKRHILHSLFAKVAVSGSGEERMGQDVDAIVRGMRRRVGAEQLVRGKKPLLIEHIRAMCDLAAVVTHIDIVMPNNRRRLPVVVPFFQRYAQEQDHVAILE